MVNSKFQYITILGSTGSIGRNTLDVIRRHSDRFRVFALSAHTQVDLLLSQCLQFMPRFAVMTSREHAKKLRLDLMQMGSKTQVLDGVNALLEICSDPEVDIVMAAIVGAAGLPACIASAQAGKRLLLANKEALVMGAGIFLKAVEDGGAVLLPVDSEHSAIFQCLPNDRCIWRDSVAQLILTASGGPFRTLNVDKLKSVTPEQACAHPNWVMGRKISVDSATMMNKALEVIEAHYLFGFEPRSIQVLIHPQSVIHSMVHLKDQSIVGSARNT